MMFALQALDAASELLMVPVNGSESLLDGIRAGIARLAGSANRRTGLVIVYDAAAPGTLWPENEINEAVRGGRYAGVRDRPDRPDFVANGGAYFRGRLTTAG